MSRLTTSLVLVSIFRNILNDGVISAFIKFLSLQEEACDFKEILKAYSDFIAKLYEISPDADLYGHLKTLLYTDENIISKGCAKCVKDNEAIMSAAAYELTLFDKLVSIDFETIKSELKNKFPDKEDIIAHLPVFRNKNVITFDINDLLNSYNTNGYGVFACCNAFKYTKDNILKPVKYTDTLAFKNLKKYEYQKEVIKNNTQAFLSGKEANNILLYGDRGCGKSSTVKALLKEFEDRNLKMIQVYKESIVCLDELFDKIRDLPCKFIIFADDLSFDENDKNFSLIKASLEGSLSNRPSNTIIYATTNRIHMVRESFSSREGSEIHMNDTIDETVSLSDRFGIILTFSLLNKTEYLEIVAEIASDCCIEPNADLYKKAEEFAALKGIRTPRTARQFITDYIASSD